MNDGHLYLSVSEYSLLMFTSLYVYKRNRKCAAGREPDCASRSVCEAVAGKPDHEMKNPETTYSEVSLGCRL